MALQAIIIILLLLASQAPEAPSDLDVALDGDKAILTWQDNSTFEEGFWIYKDKAKHAKLPPDTTYYEDDISDNRTHYYMVSSFSGEYESGLSNEVNVRSEGLPTRLIYFGIPLIVIVVIITFFLGRGKKDEEDFEEPEEPLLLTDRMTKL